MNFNKIVAVDAINLTSEAINEIKKHSLQFEEYSEDPKTVEETINRINDADCVLVSWRTPITKRVMDKCQDIKYIGVCATNLVDIDLEEAKNKNITVTNVFDYGDEATAEYVFTQLLMLARGFGKYQWKETPCELLGKTLGIVGLGAVGKEVARLGQGFGMKVVYYSRTRKPELEKQGLEFNELHELITKSDVISLHTPKDLKIFSKTEFELIPKNTVVINTTLGKAFDEQDFLDFIAKGDNFAIMDYAVSSDFYEKFNELNTVVFSEIVAAKTIESKQRLSKKVVENLLQWQ